MARATASDSRSRRAPARRSSWRQARRTASLACLARGPCRRCPSGRAAPAPRADRNARIRAYCRGRRHRGTARDRWNRPTGNRRARSARRAGRAATGPRPWSRPPPARAACGRAGADGSAPARPAPWPRRTPRPRRSSGTSASAPARPRAAAVRASGCAAGRAGRGRAGSRASRAPDSPLPRCAYRAAPCRRRYRACGRSRACRRRRRAPRDRARTARRRAAGRRHHELQLGAEQPDAGGAGLVDMRQVDGEPGIEQQRDRPPSLVTQGLSRSARYCNCRRARSRTRST